VATSTDDTGAPKRGMGTAAVVLGVIAALAIGGIIGLVIGWKGRAAAREGSDVRTFVRLAP
jgi:hypothetical protein